MYPILFKLGPISIFTYGFFLAWGFVTAILLAGREATLSDINPDVIGCYEALRSDTARLVRHLAALAASHAEAPVRHYYEVRDGRFNPMRQTAMVRRRAMTGRRWRK